VSVLDQLAGLAAGVGKSEAVDHIVQPPLQEHQHIFSGDTGLPFRLSE
jgi:hypothetical protein